MAAIIVGYDPGGANANGISYLELTDDFQVSRFETSTVSTCDEALTWLFGEKMINPADVIGAGIDSLLTWSTMGTFRPMDYFLREEYPDVQASVLSGNSAAGSMAIQGVVFAQTLAAIAPNLKILNETHPKVAYYAQKGQKHDYLTKEETPVKTKDEASTPEKKEEATKTVPKVFNEANATRMWNELLEWINQDSEQDSEQDCEKDKQKSTPPTIQVADHEWDALYSAWFTYKYGFVAPGLDLMQLEANNILDISLTPKQTSSIQSLHSRSVIHKEAGLLAKHFEQRIRIPISPKELVSYYWLDIDPSTKDDNQEGKSSMLR